MYSLRENLCYKRVSDWLGASKALFLGSLMLLVYLTACMAMQCMCARPQPIKRLLAAQFPEVRFLQTSSTHKAIAGSKHIFTALPPGQDKLNALEQVGEGCACALR